MRWVVGDMLKLTESFEASSFDVVIDKAAMDALMVLLYTKLSDLIFVAGRGRRYVVSCRTPPRSSPRYVHGSSEGPET